MLHRVLLGIVIGFTGDSCIAMESRSDLVWAVNVGGPAYVGVDGTPYVAEESVIGGDVGQIKDVLGTEDELLYQSFRQGPVEIARALPVGDYDITLHFAEPDDVDIGQRLFDVYVEGQRLISSLDVRLLRDNNIRSALTVTHGDIAVSDGVFNLRLESVAGMPVLSGLVIRRKLAPETNWQLVWRDEFESEGPPDPAHWSTRQWPARKVNSEDQAYTNRSKNVRVEDGRLILEAHREDYGEAKYTSARIHSQGKRHMHYGRVEAKARLPGGVGTWAAIWMLPADPFRYATTCDDDANWQGSHDCDAWPNSGEIDILEHVGYQMGHVHGTVHTRDYFFINQQQRKGRILLEHESEDFKRYALEWSPEKIEVFADDVLYFTFVNGGQGWSSWPFDQPFYLILNLAVGGDWGRAGGGIDDEIFPQHMAIDYVRVYRRAP